MQMPGYVALSRQIALTRSMDVSANNIANLDTAGFKRQTMLFQEHLNGQTGQDQISYVADASTVRDLSPGSIRVTDAPLDLAIEGKGYFTLETPVGPRYGRGGQFQLNAQNEIVNPNGYALLDDGGARITTPAGATNISINKDGGVSANGVTVGRIQPVNFANEQKLIHTADGLLRADGAEPFPANESFVRQGALEGSNVNAVTELVNLLQVQKDYQGIYRMIKSEHDRLVQSIRELGKVDQA